MKCCRAIPVDWRVRFLVLIKRCITMIFSLGVKKNDDENYTPVGVFLNTEGAVSADYLSFVRDVLDTILRRADDALESDARARGRTLDSGFSGVGSVPKVVDKFCDIDS